MKRNWKILCATVLAVAFAGSALAQGRGPQGGPPPGGAAGPGHGPRSRPPMDPKKMEAMTKSMVHDRMKPALKLTDAQEKKVLAIYLKSNKTMAAIWNDKKSTRDQRRKKMEALRVKNDKAVNALLTASQKKLFKTYQAKRPRFARPGGPRGAGMRPGGPPPGGPPKSGTSGKPSSGKKK